MMEVTSSSIPEEAAPSPAAAAAEVTEQQQQQQSAPATAAEGDAPSSAAAPAAKEEEGGEAPPAGDAASATAATPSPERSVLVPSPPPTAADGPARPRTHSQVTDASLLSSGSAPRAAPRSFAAMIAGARNSITGGGAAAAPSAPVAPPRGGRKGAGVRGGRSGAFAANSHETFFFENDNLGDIGVGTVGLYASRAVPTYTETTASRRPYTVSGAATSAAAANNNNSNINNNVNASCHSLEGGGAVGETLDGGRTFYTSTVYTTPYKGFSAAWQAREDAHEAWRRDRLSRSLYYTFAQERMPQTAAHTAAHSPTASLSSSADPAAVGAVRPHFTFGSDAASMETARVRAIAAERRAKEAARARQIEELSRATLARRSRSRRGEAVDLPPAYYETVREVFADKKDAAAITAKDHHRACALQRQQRQQARAIRVDERQEERAKVRTAYKAALQQSRAEGQAFQDAMLEGLPRISRKADEERRVAEGERRRSVAHSRRVERDAARRLYAQLHESEAAAEDAHRRAVKRRVGLIPPTPPSRRHNKARRRRHRRAHGKKHSSHTPAAAAAAAPAPAAAPSPAASPTSISSSANGGAPAAAAAPTPTPPPPPPPPPPAPAATSSGSSDTAAPAFFLTEVRQWQDTFQSPNTAPVTGAEKAVRDEWLARLEEERLEANREAVRYHREEQPLRLAESRVQTATEKYAKAEEGRTERRALRARRSAAEQLRLVYAGQLHDRQRSQQGRVQAAREAKGLDRRQQAELQRQQERMEEERLGEREEEEQRELQEAVAAARAEVTVGEK